VIVVADASPLIFLAKLRRLKLVSRLVGDDIRIPRVVCKEVMSPGVDPIEREELESFFASCTIVAVPRPRAFASAMSAADNAALTLAIRTRADILLCDERVTRAMAQSEGIQSLGTLGILLRAMRADLLTRHETRRGVDLLVREHGFRIGIELYQAVLDQISTSED
jgi:predicted nucleic acid-binding protein